MNVAPEISVIIPVYNVERYIGKCLDSVLTQSFTNFEVILVDDGSTDGSATICRSFSSKDSRMKYHYKENGGLSSARNYGLDVAQGNFITFIDSDDYLEKRYLSCLLEIIKEKESEIATCYYLTESPKTLKPWRPTDDIVNVYTCRDALLHLFESSEIDVCAVCKLYKKHLFDNLRFPEGRLFEDVGTTYRLIESANSVAVSHKALYHYVMRENSIAHSVDNRIFDRAELAQQAYTHIDKNYPEDTELKKAAQRYSAYHSLSVLRSVDLTNKAQLRQAEELRESLLAQRAAIKTGGYASKLDKAALAILPFGLKVYQKGWRAFSTIRKK